LREAESVASSDGAIQHIRQSFNYIGSISALARGWKPILITITSLFSIATTG
jgi:hypothetical protein